MAISEKIGEAWTLACCTFVSPRDDLSSVRQYLNSSQLKPCVSYGLVETLLHSTWKWHFGTRKDGIGALYLTVCSCCMYFGSAFLPIDEFQCVNSILLILKRKVDSYTWCFTCGWTEDSGKLYGQLLGKFKSVELYEHQNEHFLPFHSVIIWALPRSREGPYWNSPI